MKKHQLIKYAYDNYPVGTKYNCAYSGEPKIVSKQDFDFYEHDHSTGIRAEPNKGMLFYAGTEKWAEVLPATEEGLLDGKCAIQVNNEREFKLLMEYYAKKGWGSYSSKGISATMIEARPKHSNLVSYSDKFVFPNTDSSSATDETDKDYQLFNSDFYKKIPFQAFAAEVGIKVPVFILRSQDGVNLNEGDSYFRAWLNSGGKWVQDQCFNLESCHAVVTKVGKAIAFSTKEAARKWVTEQNKPKEIAIDLGMERAVLSNENGISFFRSGFDKSFFGITGEELEKIYNTHQSLKPF